MPARYPVTPLGQTYLTPGAKDALEALPDGDVTAEILLARHLGCDWGDDLDHEDTMTDGRAVHRGNGRILFS